MSRSGLRVRAGSAATASVVLVALAACTGFDPTTISTPSPSPAAKAACRQLMSALPGTVVGQSGAVNQSSLVAYWGERTPVILRCGVPTPASQQPDSRCDVVSSIGWFSEKLDDGYRFTTIGRAANVEVTVPSVYAPEADALNQLAPAVAKVAEVKPCV